MLVRSGESRRLGETTQQRKRGEVNSAFVVYTEMLLQIARDYPGLPDARTLTFSEIKFFYEGVRHEIERATAPK